MTLRVEPAADGHRLVGPGVDVELANRFLAHLAGRNFAAATRRAYAYDVLSFLRFCDEARLALAEVGPTDVFDYLGWRPRATAGHVVVRLQRLETAPATKNRRVAALRALFEHLVLSGVRSSNPVPVGRKVRAGERRRGLLGHLGNAGRRTGGRLVVQPRRLPESLELTDVAMFLAGLLTARDRAMVLAMLLGGCGRRRFGRCG
ncbi:MAG TPA: site-specific integrase [Propionibacteriaceae bacterium]|nr:site-specific integrase [Propionibacteriaceae bacterium]